MLSQRYGSVLTMPSLTSSYVHFQWRKKKITSSIWLMRKENGSGRVILLALWTFGELLCFIAQKLLKIALGKQGDISCCKEWSMFIGALMHYSSRALHWNQLEEVVSLVWATLVFIFRQLKQAQASTAPTLSIHLQPNVGQTAVLLAPPCLFSLENRSHATRKSCTEDTHVHSCWKMKLQVGECLVSRGMLLSPAR